MNNISKKAALKFLDAALEQSSHKEIMDAVLISIYIYLIDITIDNIR